MQHPDQKMGNENSCWTTFLDCSSGAPDIKAGFQTAGICSGGSIDGTIAIGTPICQNRGQVNTVLSTAETFFSKNGMPNSWWIIPVIGGGGNCDPTTPTKIVTWAQIKPTAVDKSGNPKDITADVKCGDDINQDLNVSLCFTHRLVRDHKRILKHQLQSSRRRSRFSAQSGERERLRTSDVTTPTPLLERKINC